MSIDLFGKLFKTSVLYIVLVEIFSLLGHLYPVFNTACFFVILFLVLIISLEKLEYGLYVLLAEIAIGSHGYLFALEFGGIKLSIRIGLFLVIMGVWLLRFLQKRDWGFFKKKELRVFWVFFLIIAIAIINALRLGNSFSNLFFDMNAYLFFALILPFLWAIDNWEKVVGLLQVYIGALVTSLVKVFFLFYLFTHDTWAIAPAIYKWVRDTRVGEITKMDDGFFRIFFQSQIYTLIGFFILIFFLFGYYFLNKKVSEYKKDKDFYYLVLLVAGLFSSLVISLSRSYWAGMILAGGFWVLMMLVFYKKRWFFIKHAIFMVVLLIGSAYLIMFVLANFPLPYKGTESASISFVKERVLIDNDEAAVASRWSQLSPLMNTIMKHPLIGNGFGATVTYQSSDPRVVSRTGGSGIYTTYAFEWGYLDMWLKLGLIGIIGLLWLLWDIFWKGINITYVSLRDLSSDKMNLKFILGGGFVIGFIALCVTHGFSPYLNHPLGILYLIAITTLLQNINREIGLKTKK